MEQTISVRVLSSVYWTVALVSLTASASFFTRSYATPAFCILLFVPLVLLASHFERIIFDGKTLMRKGLLAFLESIVFGHPMSLPIDTIEMVATEAIRSRRGLQQIKYFYKIIVAGGNIQIVIRLNGRSKKNSNDLVKELFNSLEENKLDPRSSELKQYLNDQRSKEVLIDYAKQLELTEDHIEKNISVTSLFLRELANSLKLEGYMQQAFRCFNLAYKLDPRNARLLYEMARFLRSLAMIDNPRLLTRSRACLRRAAFLAKDEPQLLARIGETHFERFEYKQAAKCFLRALVIEPTLYRANIGLAEIALRDGKLAHVAHFYSAAASTSNDPAQRELAVREAVYYERLCSDEDYLAAELNRITKLRHFQWARNSSALLLFVFWIGALLIAQVSTEMGRFAWFAVFSSGLVWISSVFFTLHYSQRHQ